MHCKVSGLDYDEEMEFRIVGSTEANSLKNKISNESPVGQALIGKSVGDVVDVETQAGVIEYKVLEISAFSIRNILRLNISQRSRRNVGKQQKNVQEQDFNQLYERCATEISLRILQVTEKILSRLQNMM